MPKRAATRKGRAKQEKVESQSAIEFLLTYGWALLLIAIALGFLFQLGIFVPSQPRALPGSCQVYRPDGPYSTEFTSLLGACTSRLPLFVTNFANGYLLSGGVKGKGLGTLTFPSYVNVQPLPMGGPNGQGTSFTIVTWIYWLGPTPTHCQGILATEPSPSSGFALWGYGGNQGACASLWINGSNVKWPQSGSYSYPQNMWEMITATYDSDTGAATVYVNSTLFSSGTASPRSYISVNSISIGAVIWPSNNVYPFNGYITNVQLYNVPLSANDVQALYIGGMGGPPIRYQNLLGWWPLNGNSNDYSGNGNGGTVYNISFYSGYTPPPGFR